MSKDLKVISQEVKQELQRKYPDCTWSVRIQRYSGGQSMTVSLMSAPFPAFAKYVDCNGNKITNGHAQLNQYQFQDSSWEREHANNGAYLTKEAWDTLADACTIANKENWDKSDIQSDYFNVNYYLHMEIGNWNKPFLQTMPTDLGKFGHRGQLHETLARNTHRRSKRKIKGKELPSGFGGVR